MFRQMLSQNWFIIVSLLHVSNASVYACVHLVCPPGLVHHGGATGLFDLREGGAGHDFKSVNLSVLFWRNDIFDMSSNCCMLCGHGSKKSSASSDCPSSSKLLGICHLTLAMAKINTQLVLEYIAAMGDDAFVMRQLDRIRQPSSVETGADVIKEFLVWIWQMCQLDLQQFYLPILLPFSLDTFKIICLTNDYCWSCLGQCFMPVRCLWSWALSVNLQRGPLIAVIAQIPLPFLQSLQNEFWMKAL